MCHTYSRIITTSMNSRWYDCATFLDFFNCCNLHWEFEILEQKERRSKRTRRARLELSKFTATFSFGYGDFKIKTMLNGICDSHFDNGVHNRAISILKRDKILTIIMPLERITYCINFLEGFLQKQRKFTLQNVQNYNPRNTSNKDI